MMFLFTLFASILILQCGICESEDVVPLLIGGWGSQGSVPTMEVLPISNDENACILDISLPESLNGGAAFYTNGNIIYCGGVNEKEEETTRKCISNDLSGDGEWQEIASLNEDRTLSYGFVYNDIPHVFGGMDFISNTLFKSAERLVDGRWELYSEMEKSDARLFQCSAFGEATLFVMGGREDMGLSNAFQKFDLRTEQWVDMPSMPTPTVMAACLVSEGDVFVVGGLLDGTKLSQVQKYNVQSSHWVELTPLNKNSYSASLFSLDGVLTLVGGRADSSDDAVLQYVDETWVPIDRGFSESRVSMASVLVPAAIMKKCL